MNLISDIKIASGQFIKEKKYWLNQLSGEIEKCYFPYDNCKDMVEYRKESETFKISGDIYERLLEITGGSYPKMHMVLVASAAILSALYTGIQDMIVGTSIERQNTEDSFINTILPLRISIPVQITFKELILEIRKIINEAIENQNYPIETLLPGQGRLFDVMVLLVNIQEKKYVEHFPTSILFFFRAAGSEVEGELEYDTSKYEKESIFRIINHFLHLLRITLFNVNIKISDIELLSEEEKKELSRYNCTHATYPHQKTIHALFAEQVEKSPNNISVVDENQELPQQITYRELHEKSNRLAKGLMQKGIGPGKIVGIMMECSIDMIIGIMGILKTGGSYLPIDPVYPQERIDYMLKDSGTEILLTNYEREKIANFQLPIVNCELLMNESTASFHQSSFIDHHSNQLAYIIYTSVSTGKPKGVAIEHRSLVNYAQWAVKMYVKNEIVNFPLYTSIGFDLTITSLFTPLISGNTIYIYRGEVKEFLLDKIFAENKVEAVKLTPVHLMIIGDTIQKKNISKIKRFIVGGDKLETQWANNIHHNLEGNIEIYNEYGPTEATVGCMTYKYDPQKDKWASVPIGVPADNTQIYLLDKLMRHSPIGGIGELYIGGDGLARGYLNNPELTNEKFISNPFDPRKKIYKAGDTARRIADGNIEFLGRKDHQVKIRGFRIELGEIENVMLKYPQVQEAIVMAREDKHGDKYLCAYLVAAPGLNIMELKNYLLAHLPGYMLPVQFVQLDELPLSPNGKIDRGKLPEPEGYLNKGFEYQAPQTDLEKTLAGIWQKELGLEKIGIHDNYFNIGGDSIKSIRLINTINEELNKNLKLVDLYANNTIEKLAQRIGHEQQCDVDDASQVSQEYDRVLSELDELHKRIMGEARGKFGNEE